jgi:hypothetical protein
MPIRTTADEREELPEDELPAAELYAHLVDLVEDMPTAVKLRFAEVLRVRPKWSALHESVKAVFAELRSRL